MTTSETPSPAPNDALTADSNGPSAGMIPVTSSPSASRAVDPPTSAPVDDYEELTPELVEDEAIRGDFVIRWAVVLLAFLLGSTKINEESTLVEIRSGQFLTSHGFLPPRTDVFSSTATDRIWPNLSWGFDLILASIYSVAESWGISGFVGVSVLKALLAAIAFGFLAQISRRGLPTWWSSICVALALVACHLRLSAHPTLMTFLGLSILFWVLCRYREQIADPETKTIPKLWVLLPWMLVWCNLDSRAFLGVSCLLLYALGESIGARLGAATTLSPGARKHLWTVSLACVATLLVHPWHYHSLLSPWQVYGSEYTAAREYASQAYVGAPKLVYGSESWYFPLWSGTVWEQFDLAAAAGATVIAAAAALLVLNSRRIVWGELFSFAGMLGFAVISLRELPAAAIVAAVVAGLNGQAWYQARFSQVYTTNPFELLFSRGGRALTVLALAALAFFGGTGRLRDPAAAQSGYGLDNSLASQIGDLEMRLIGTTQSKRESGPEPKVDEPISEKSTAAPKSGPQEPRSFDDHPFNFTLRQGDLLIWIGLKPFVDSRLALYYDQDESRNLLAVNQKLKQALRIPRPAATMSGSGRPSVKGTDSALVAEQSRERRAYWRGILDQHQITHVLVRLSTSAAQQRDYEAFSDLLNSRDRDWRLVDLGVGCAVFYRSDLDDPALEQFVERRSIDFNALAYRNSFPSLSARDRWVRSPGFYQRYLWSKRRDTPPAIQQALQFVQLASLPESSTGTSTLSLPPEYVASRAALALLAVRKAQEGLQEDPDATWGYLVLGEAYSILAKWEAVLAQNQSRNAYSGLRYLQAVSSFHQALVSSPDSIRAHEQLASLYAQANRVDLELRHQQAIFDLLNPIPEVDAEMLLSIETRIRDLKKLQTAIEEKGESGGEPEDQRMSPYERSIQLATQGFLLKSLEILDRIAEARTGSLRAEQTRILLQIEAGRTEEAYETAERFAQPAQDGNLADWQDVVALANLANADYPRAQALWRSKSEEAVKESLGSLLTGLIPIPKGELGWPLSATLSTANWMFERPERASEARLNLALILLEEGNLDAARREFELALETNPESPNRTLIRHYLSELRGSPLDVDPFPPSQTIPGLFASDEEFANRSPIPDELE